MTTEAEDPVYIRAPHAPWREVLWQRWSGRRDRALVLRDPGGVHHLAGARRKYAAPPGAVAFEEADTASPPSAPRTRLRGYESAFLVRLGERPGKRSVALPTHYGTESMDVHVGWWVHDPVQVVRSQTAYGWLAVRRALARGLRHLRDQFADEGHALGAAEIMQSMAAPNALPECGLTYRVIDISAREDDGELLLGEPTDLGLPYSWTDRSREEYDFCKRAVREGPTSLAALWLVRQPDQVSQVLDWTVNHAGLIRGDTTWQDEVAGLLGGLTAQERQELSELLRDRLVSLGRQVPGQQGSEAGAEQARTRVNGWTGGPTKARPV